MFDIVAEIMHFRFLALVAAVLLTLAQNTAAQFKYPDAPTSNQVDDYNGVKVADPYRPLENPDSPESRAWIEAENKITFDFLKTIPERDGIKKRLTEVWDYERFGVPFKEKDRYFFSKNTGLQNQNVLYTTTNFFEKPRELLDPNVLAKDGTIALGGVDVTDDGRYLIITVQRGTDPKNRIFYKNLVDPNSKVVELLDKADARYVFIDNEGPVFAFRTNLNAPLGRIVTINTSKPLPAQIEELVPQSKDKLEAVNTVGDRFVAVYLKDAHSAVKLFKLDGSSDGEIALPGLGTAAGFTGKRKDRETFYSFASFTTPTEIFRYDFDKRASEVLFKPKVKFNPDDYATEQVFYKSADGTRVPMFISYKKGMKRDGRNPTYLFGYGGFDISETPTFAPANLVWMEMGGIFALPNLRGGGEYGEKWHEAGMLHVKQNVFDDFIAAAQYLIDNHYTSTPKLAIGGGSNGGLLVGACITQRPDIYASPLTAVGVIDMLRFSTSTIG